MAEQGGYAPGSAVSAHAHTGGEEFLVLDGVFQDEHGDFPVGTYVRNPPTSSHTPSSAAGVTIFVKLWQFEMDDRQQITIDTTTQSPQPVRAGVSEIPLFEDTRERVRIELWEASVAVTQADHNRFEALVIEGRFHEGDEDFGVNSWLRLPPHTPLNAVSGTDGARLWVKSGHLADTPSASNAGG
ncbi:cupin domain-containing protein [Rhodobacteraceae bacterium KMM 6894]|nr:cupin domain-containing protein [Rhodobacteraceae bacterium KMM 6894]